MHIMFICTGNTCRSPMAEALALALLPDLTVSSAGIGADDGDAAMPDAIAALTELAARDPRFAAAADRIRAHRSRRFTAALYDSADLLLTMEDRHRESIVQRFGGARPALTLREAAAEQPGDVDDPFGRGAAVYQGTLDELIALIEQLAARLPELRRRYRL